MDPTHALARLGTGPAQVTAVIADCGAEESRFRPAGGGWTIREVVGHLLDEERDDFRPRLALTLRDPAAAWPPLDPEAAVPAHGHQERDLADLLAAWRAERAASLAWLRDLVAPDWTRAHPHPKWGPITAGDLLASWAAHDLLHARQVIRRRYEFLLARSAPASLRYAGEW